MLHCRCISNLVLRMQMVSSLFHGSLAGVGWMLVACFFFSILAVVVKTSQSALYFPEILFYRSLPTVCILGLIMPYQGHSLKTVCPKEQFYRATFGSVAMAMGFFANIKLPLGLAITLSYTTPIFLALLMYVWFKQRLEFSLLFCIVFGFLGIMMLLRPSGIAFQHWKAGLCGLGAGLFSAMAFMNIQVMAKCGEPEWRTVFYFSCLSTVYTLFATLAWYGGFHAITFERFKLILGLGVPGLLGQLCLTRAYGRGHPNVTSLFSYSTIVLSTLWGWLFFNEHLDILSGVGASIVLGSGILATLLKRSPSLSAVSSKS